MFSIYYCDKANEIEELKKKIYNECKTQEGGSDSDVEGLLKLEVPKTKGGMCILACSHEKLGIVISINVVEFLCILLIIFTFTHLTR